MATVNLGRIKPQWQGNYASETSYVIDDMVLYNNSAYICTAASQGNAPTDTNYWDLMTQGFSGDAATLTSGTIPDARFPATLPAISGANLTGVTSFPQLVGLFYKDTNQNINSATWTRVTWDGTIYDPNTILYQGDQFRPTELGWYSFTWRFQMSQADMNKGIGQRLDRNGAGYFYSMRPAGNDTDGGGGGPHDVSVTTAYARCTSANSDVFDINIFQSSGGRVLQGYQQTNNRLETTVAIHRLTET